MRTCYVCGFHNVRETREILASFFCDLIKDKLAAGGVRGRDPADDDDSGAADMGIAAPPVCCALCSC